MLSVFFVKSLISHRTECQVFVYHEECQCPLLEWKKTDDSLIYVSSVLVFNKELAEIHLYQGLCGTV